MMRVLIPFLGLFFLPLGVSQAAMSGREIMAKNEDLLKLDDVTARATLITRKKDQAEKKKVFTLWRKVREDKIHYHSLTQFHEPAEVKNEAILFAENDQGENDIFLYLPAYKKVRRVERSQQSGSFMGSEFSYSDITTPHAADYNQKLLKEEACDGGTCFVIECVPVSDSIRERTGYSKVTSWVRKDNFMNVRNDYVDLAGKASKRITLSGAKVVSKKGKWMSHKIEVLSLKDGGMTTLAFENVKADQGIEDSKFTQQYLLKMK